MIGEMARKVNVSLDRDSVRDLIMNAAASKRAEIREELSGLPLYVKIDGCTRHNRTFVGVNVQFAGPDGSAQIRTLAVRDCEGQHSAEHTKSLLQNVMTDFGISMHQLLAVVSDNAANMVKTVKLLNEDSEAGDEQEAEDSEAEDGEDTDSTGSCASMIDMIPGSISHMRCAAHTLQLAVRDGIR